MNAWLLATPVATVAAVYAAVGHAGATGYVAVMGLAGLPPDVIRPTALMLNVVVAAIATTQFVRAGHFRRELFLPLAVASMPAAAVGGWLALPAAVFEAAVGLVLAFSAVRIGRDVFGRGAVAGAAGEEAALARRLSAPWLAAIGAGLGLAAGLTGVGGGVFLTPVLLAVRAAPMRQVAAVSAAFILVNSLAGLAGWVAAGRGLTAIDPVVVAGAAVGGLLGASLGAFRLPLRALRILVAVVLASASLKLLGGSIAVLGGPRPAEVRAHPAATGATASRGIPCRTARSSFEIPTHVLPSRRDGAVLRGLATGPPAPSGRFLRP